MSRARGMLAGSLLAALLALATPAAGQSLRVVPAGAEPIPVPPLDAPAASAALPGHIDWVHLRPGLERAELELRAGPAGLPVRAILVRVDPARFRFRLELRTRDDGMRGAWTIDDAPADAALAVNAGHFRATGPWGWVVRNGRTLRDPGQGPLVVALAFDSAGALRWLPPAALASGEVQGVVEAFQSYPVLLLDGSIPALVREGSPDIRLDHRDARLLLAEFPDGTLLLLLTRFDALGGIADRVPVGLTVPESAALARALGVRHAVMLDGGVSGQMLVRDAAGTTHAWRGMRKVPLALVAVPR